MVLAVRPRVPVVDVGLPAAAVLLDADRMARVITGPAPDPVRLRVRYLDWDPGHSLLVLYDAITAGGSSEVVASVGLPLPTQGALDQLGEVARPRCLVPTPVLELPELDALVSWWPADPWLPLLALAPDVLAAEAGEPAGQPVHRLAWTPRTRAVLRIGSAVLKLHRTARVARRADVAQQLAAGLLPTAIPRRGRPDIGLVVQDLVPGRALLRADALPRAGAAARLIRQLHAGLLEGLEPLDPLHLLEQAAAPVRLVSFVRPELAGRLTRVVHALHATLPAEAEPVPSHGDFNVGQLLLTPRGELVVTDTDTLCAAPPGHDLGSYAANLVSGRPGDLAEARRALAALTAAYGDVVEAPEWYLAVALLRRVDRAVRRLKKDWPVRTESLVSAVEALTG